MRQPVGINTNGIAGAGGVSVMFAEQQNPHHNHHNQRHYSQQPLPTHQQNGHHGQRRVQIVDSFYPPPPAAAAHQHHQREQSYPGTNGGAANGYHNTAHHEDYHYQQPQEHMPMMVGSPPSAADKCQCCPFGFHIDLGFVKFAEDVAAGKEQIQNWSSAEKKRARRLMASPSSERPIGDISIGSSADMAGANVSSSYRNESSMMSKSLDVDELPELVDHPPHPPPPLYHQNHNQPIQSSPYTNGTTSSAVGRPRAPSVPITSYSLSSSPFHHHHQQQHNHGILKHTSAEHQQQQFYQYGGMPKTAPIPISKRVAQQIINPAYNQQHQHYGNSSQQQQQHQSRYYEAHVQQQKQLQQQQRAATTTRPQQYAQYPETSSLAHSMSAAEVVHSSPTTITHVRVIVGSPLRTSTPRANEDAFVNSHHRHNQPLQISTGPRPVANGGNAIVYGITTTATSAPSSPVPESIKSSWHQYHQSGTSTNYQTAIAQSMAQLRRSPQKAMTAGTFSTKPQAHTSLSALSMGARTVCTNPPITTAPSRHRQQQQQPQHHYLETGGIRRVLSPEPNMPSSMAVRSSNMQNRAFFHQNNNNNNNNNNSNNNNNIAPASAHGTVNRVPYRSRGAGSAPQIGGGSNSLSFAPSTVELSEFSSVRRRRRLDADIGNGGGGSGTLHSSQLIRSLSPPVQMSTSAYAASTSSSGAGSGSLPRWLDMGQSPPSTGPFSMDNLTAGQMMPSSEFYDEGTLKADKSKKKKQAKTVESEKPVRIVPIKPVQTILHQSSTGTQTPQRPAAKEIGICTERQVHPQQQFQQVPPPPPQKRQFFTERGTSPALMMMMMVEKEREEEDFNASLGRLIQFTSIGVDTRDLLPQDEDSKKGAWKKSPPAPPPKPKGAEVEAELFRRKQKELMGKLVTEFQYCLGHEPEYHPDHKPTLIEKKHFVEAGQQANLVSETIDRGVDAFSAAIIHSVSTSTTDLASPIKLDASTSPMPPPAPKKTAEKGIETIAETKIVGEIGVQTEEEEVQRQNIEQKSQMTDSEAQTENGWLELEIGRRLADAEAERKEKRKRNSVERGTETDEEEAPDQFIMITCNKCEQRSSVASDELFEKIVDEGSSSAAGTGEQIEAPIESMDMFDSLPIMLETVKEEPEFLSSHEEIKIPSIPMPETSHSVTIKEEEFEILMRNKADKHNEVDRTFKSADYEATKYHDEEFDKIVEYAEDEAYYISKDKAEKPFLEEENKITQIEKEDLQNLDSIVQLEQMLKETPIVAAIPVHELSRSMEFKSTEMWPYVNLPVPIEIAIDLPSSMKEKIPSPKPKIVIAKPMEEAPLEGPPTMKNEQKVQPSEITRTILESSQMEETGGNQEKVLSTSPLSSDEGLVLAEEEDFDMDLDADRISIETDVQTVICLEPGVARSVSSASSSSKTPTTPTLLNGAGTESAETFATGNSEASASIAVSTARAEALRKLLTEPPRRMPFQRDVDSNRSYRCDKNKMAQQLDMDYIADRHKSTDSQRQQQPEPSTPCSSTQTKKALKETISLKKSSPFGSSFASSSSASASFPPDPIPARIPRPKIARYSPSAVLAETPDEEAEAADRLTPLRSEMRSLSAWGTGSASPRMSQRALIFRTQIGGPLEEESEDDLEVEASTSSASALGGGISSSSGSSSKEQLPEDSSIEEDEDDNGTVVVNDVEDEVGDGAASSTSSEGARTYEMSEDESATEFELSAPLRDALETISDHLMQGNKTPTQKDQQQKEENEEDQQQKSNQIDWAYKYAQHEWLKMSTKKSANAELVEQFIDALESYSTQLMDTVINLTDQNGNTALHYAVSNENFDVVSVLLDSKVCRVDQMNKAGYSALMLGALCELRNETECAIMQRMFHMGNVNAKAVKHAQTALMLAASHGRVEATNLLLKCGADVNIQDVDGSTALMCAAEHGQKEIVKILLKQSNIDASLTDCDNQTALSIAVENQHRDIGVLIYAHLNFSRLADTSSENSVNI